MDTTALLTSLSRLSCITGKGGAAKVAFEEIKRYSPNAYFDKLGSIIAPITPPKADGKHLMLDAHLDEIGFIVTGIDDHGFLRIAKVGGPDLRVLLGQEVTVFGIEPLFGIFCCRPPHLTKKEDYKKPPEIDELAIDIGLDHDSAADIISLGDYVTLRRESATLQNGLMTGKALDNRAGIAAIIRTLELLGGNPPDVGLTVMFSISEECGERGARPGTFAVSPTHAIIIDVSHALTPDAPREKCGELKKGPMIGVSPVLSKAVTQRLFESAAHEYIPYQTEVMGGETGTNSDVISISGLGVKTGLISIPLRYMHTAAEVIALEDIENTARLLTRYIMTAGKNEAL